MHSIPISQVDVSFFVHATEDKEKVLKAVRRILDKPRSEDNIFQKTDLKGHYGNTITLLETTIQEKPIEVFLKNLCTHLVRDEKRKLLLEFGNHLDAKGNLYLRLDKQAAYLGNLKLGSVDPICIRIKPKTRQKNEEEMIRIYDKIGLLC